MSVDFFDTDCREVIRTNKKFGICDKQDGTKAYTDIEKPEDWIASVINETQINIAFTAIDNCITILKEGSYDHESTCDGMLTFNKSLYLIELKNQRAGWLADAIGQLENTIKLLNTNNELEEFQYKKAYACNKKHPNFQVMEAERKRKFYDKTGFRLDAQARIVVK